MPTAQIFQGTVYEDCSYVVVARLQGISGANVVQASLTAITAKIVDQQTGLIVDLGALSIPGTIFNTLQIDGRSFDAIGYNFASVGAGGTVPNGNRIYRFEGLFTETGGSVWPLLVDLHALSLVSS